MQAADFKPEWKRLADLPDAEGFAGILSYWKWAELIYVEHLAIAPERRGRGLGHLALQLLPPPFILNTGLCDRCSHRQQQERNDIYLVSHHCTITLTVLLRSPPVPAVVSSVRWNT